MWTISAKNTEYGHRVGHAVVTCIGADEAPLADQPVTIRQVNHDFLFGNIGFDFIDLATGEDTSEATTQLAEDYLALFNATTLPFYLARFEPERGRPDTERLLAAARYFVERGHVLKGHPLVWHTQTPPWLNSLPLPEVEATLRGRIRRDVGDFAGLIDMWDAINEAVIMPVFTAEENGVTKLAYVKGRLDMMRLAFEEARATNPQAYLLLNDFDLSTGYECLIEGALEAGIKIDAIGLQTHMQQGYRGEAELLDKVEKFARYGLPIHLTETTLVSGELMPRHIVDLNDFQVPSWPTTPEGEERQADEMVRHYTSMVSHPAVKAVVYWGFTDANAWLGAPMGFVRADGTHKPSYDALSSLVKGEWWIPETVGRTDADGQFSLTGWLGTYDVTVAGTTHRIHLSQPGRLTVEVRGTAE
ncbi:MAG: endo-1,4-beta-xylanase [Propionibacteriaceae bacterium]|jgi:GH35 family endo-1,4-beta-xylanase|nr:endo-1,4-beta-xylanase [Propionibacteriaceae bacterium]